MKVNKLSKNSLNSHIPDSRKEEQEYGPGKKEIAICSECSAVYFNKNWHHQNQLDDYAHLTEDKEVNFVLCPACTMKRDNTFEGMVIVEHIPDAIRKEVEALIYHIADRANERDPMDRILSFKPYGEDGFEIHTSENQLAISIGKQIVSAHKDAKMDIQLSKEESAARVRVEFSKES
ncbi:MAG: hypothetical protein HYV65_01500 [Candidatus Spechtbacteria bacterium]|nr:hypothetical protein [Candidatus Spechtbacteria bacterium]